MILRTNGKHNFLLVLAALFLTVALILNSHLQRKEFEVSKQDSSLNFNRHLLALVSFGNKRLIGNLIWIQTLLSSDLEHYKNRDLNSWMFHRFLTISHLDPLFYENYLYGGLYLSIVKDDLEGAAHIYQKGIEFFPLDYKLIYNAGFNYYFEMGDNERGYEMLKKIENHPQAPQFLPYLLNRLRFETGTDYQTILNFLLHRLEGTSDPVLVKKLKGDIYSLKAEHDLKCLNSEGPSKCQRLDAEGSPYFYQDGAWKSAKSFVPYRINRVKSEKAKDQDN
jgi:hypothetical protein